MQKLSLFRKGKALYTYPLPTWKRGSSSIGIRSFLVEAGDPFRVSCLMAWQLSLGSLDRPRFSHEEVNTEHAQIAGLVLFRPARTWWPSGRLSVTKYLPTEVVTRILILTAR